MSLTLKKLTSQNGEVGDRQWAVVDVPEFGTDPDGNPYTVNVHSITVGDRSLLGQVASGLNSMEHGKVAIMAAIASRDDEGNLVFGRTKGDAIRRVESLPEHYMPAVARIAMAALHLTAGYAVTRDGERVVEDGEQDADEEANPLDDESAQELAEKN